MSTAGENYLEVKKRVAEAAIRSGRKPDEVMLIAVSKTKSVEEIMPAVEAGANILGENKVQEVMAKYELIKNVRWHLIGHLQTNKVKYIIDKVSMIHSVDSLKLANEISKRAVQAGVTMDVLVEVNIGAEKSKSGVAPEEAESLCLDIAKLDGICVKGLMTVAPFVDNPQDTRVYFRKMNKLFVDIKDKKYDNIDMTYLSMGMTNDFEVAIEEGANIVRVGTAIFGARNYNVQ
jgi:pyridoxal phosphate enzyme (YggS family)